MLLSLKKRPFVRYGKKSAAAAALALSVGDFIDRHAPSS